MAIEKEVYGQHLSVRLTDIKEVKVLNSSKSLEALLIDIVAALDMHILAGPLMGKVEDTSDENGVSGVVIVQESHIAIHSYYERRTLFMDIFSCKKFDVDSVFKRIKKHLVGFKITEQSILERGLHWDKPISSEYKKWLNKR